MSDYRTICPLVKLFVNNSLLDWAAQPDMYLDFSCLYYNKLQYDKLIMLSKLKYAKMPGLLRALDKLLFRMSTVLVHLKKKGVTRNFNEYSLNAINSVLHLCKKRKSCINTLFHKG